MVEGGQILRRLKALGSVNDDEAGVPVTHGSRIDHRAMPEK